MSAIESKKLKACMSKINDLLIEKLDFTDFDGIDTVFLV